MVLTLARHLPRMDTPAVKPGALLQETYDLVKAHPIALLVPLAILGLIGGLGSGRQTAFSMRGSPMDLIPFAGFLGLLGIVVAIALFLANCFAALMTTKAAFAASLQHRNLDFAAASAEAGPLFVASIGTFLIWLLVVIVGFILLIVPGFIALTGLLPLVAVISAEGTQGVDALKRAWALTTGHKLDLFWSLLIVGLANFVASLILGFIPVIGGALSGIVNGVAFAVYLVIGVLAYQHLRREATHQQGSGQGTP